MGHPESDKAELSEEERWASRGYETEEPCDVCGEAPGKVDLKLSYVVCRKHMYLTPRQVADAISTGEIPQ